MTGADLGGIPFRPSGSARKQSFGLGLVCAIVVFVQGVLERCHSKSHDARRLACVPLSRWSLEVFRLLKSYVLWFYAEYSGLRVQLSHYCQPSAAKL